MFFITIGSFDENDTIIKFLKKHDIPIIEEDREKMTVAVTMTDGLAQKMRDEIELVY